MSELVERLRGTLPGESDLSRVDSAKLLDERNEAADLIEQQERETEKLSLFYKGALNVIDSGQDWKVLDIKEYMNVIGLAPTPSQ